MKRQTCKKCNIGCFESISCPKCGGDLITVTEAELMKSSTHELTEALTAHYESLGMTKDDAATVAGQETATDINKADWANIGDQF